MKSLLDLADGDYAQSLNEREQQDNLAWIRSRTQPAIPAQPKMVTPETAAYADTFWSDFLGSTAADITDVLTRGITFGVIEGKHIPFLGSLVERYKTPEERKSTLRKAAEMGIELTSGMVIGGPLLSPIGKAATSALLRSTAGTVAKGAVAGAVEGGVVGAAQAGAGLYRGEDTAASAAMKVAGGAALGGAFGAVVGKYESFMAKRAEAKLASAQAAKAKLEGVQAEGLSAEAAAVDDYIAQTKQWADQLDVVQPKVGEPLHPDAEATSAALGGRPIEAGPVREPIAALNPAPEPPAPEIVDPRKLLKLADDLEAGKLGKGERVKAIIDEQVRDLRERAMAAQASDVATEAVQEVVKRAEWPKWRQDLLKGGMTGNVEAGLAQKLGQSVLGALVGGPIGAATGDEETRTRNAILGAMGGAVLAPALVSGLTKALTPKVAKLATEHATVAGGTVQPTPTKRAIKIEPIDESVATKVVAESRGAPITDGERRLSVPWKEVDSSEKLDELVRATAKEMKASVDAARRGTQTQEEQVKIAKQFYEKLAKTYDTPAEYFLSKAPGTALNAEETRVFTAIMDAAKKETNRLYDAAMQSPEQMGEFVRQFSVWVALLRKRFGFSAEWGRAGQALQDSPIAGMAERDALKMADILGTDAGMEALRHGVSPQQLHKMFGALREGAEREAKVHGIGQWMLAAQNGVMEAWINGLLSGPPTMVANLFGDAAALFLGPLERGVAARIGSNVQRGESAEMLYAIWHGWNDAWVAASKSFRTGESLWGAMSGKVEAPIRAISSEAFGIDSASGWGRAVDLLGNVVRVPGRLLNATDEAFKLLNFRSEQAALTFREATKLASETGGDAKAILAQLRADVPDSIVRQAAQFAKVQTYTNDLGQLGQRLVQLSNSNLAAKAILPFVQAPINLATYTLERLPVINLALSRVRQDLATGGVAREMALAKMGLGSMFLGTAAVFAAAGGITGKGPSDPILKRRLQETGWQPYSIKIGDTYYAYSRLDPIGMALGMVGDYAEIVGNVDNPTGGQLGMAVLVSVLKNITSKTYVQGLSNALEAMMNPESKGFQTYFELQARTIVPRAVAVFARTESDPMYREVNGMMDAIRSQIPGLSSTLPPRRDLYGEPVMLEGSLGPDFVSPVYRKAMKDDPVAREIARHQVRVDGASDWMEGYRPGEGMFANDRATHGVMLSPQQKDRWAQYIGKGDGTSLRQALTDVIQSDTYQAGTDGPDGTKAMYLQRVVANYREQAKQQLLMEDPELRYRLSQKLAARQAARGMQQ